MTYAVTEDCINCKHMDCVTVCPVNWAFRAAHLDAPFNKIYDLYNEPEGCG
jgi:ferredoxin